MAKDLNVSEAKKRRVLKKDIGARSLVRAKMFFIIDRLKAFRLEFTKKLLHMLKKKRFFVLRRKVFYR